MVEAVSSNTLNAALLRQTTEQGGVRSSSASKQDTVKAPYVDKIGFAEKYANEAVLIVRDSQTGDQVDQIPSEEGLEARRRQEEARQADIADVQARNAQKRQAAEGGARSSEFSVSVIAQNSGNEASGSSQNSGPIAQAALAAFSSGAQSGQAVQSAGVNFSA